MNVQHTPTQTAKRSSTGAPPVSWRWIVLARCLWLALAVFTLAIFGACLPVYLAQLQTICTGTYGTTCTYLQLSSEQAEVLKGFGLSAGDYAVFTVALVLALIVVCLVVSTLIIWRGSHDRMALLVALMLVTFGPITLTSSVLGGPSLWQVLNECLYFLGWALFVLVFLLFPSGQFMPRWTRWTFVVFLAVQVPTIFFPHAPFMLKIHADTLGYPLLVGEVAIAVAVQLYRYRRVSSPLERQQTKWVVFGFAVPLTVYLGGRVLYLIFPAVASPQSSYGAPYQLALNAISICLVLLIPLSFGVAILRYRLWDIDRLINRTLVYGGLSVMLALLSSGLVIGLQSLVRLFSGQASESPIITVASTLALVALFQPLRHRLQQLIDRRFYRSKYDAAKTLVAFSATLQSEVGLTQLSEQLVAVVEETMQPTHVSLWLVKRETRPDKPVKGGDS